MSSLWGLAVVTAVRCKLSRCGRVGHGASVSSIKTISLTTSDAGSKTSFDAFFFTIYLIFAATIAPTGAGWL